MEAAAIVLILIFVFIIYVAMAIKIIQQHELGLSERFGRYRTTLQPGFNMIVPFIDRVQKVDMREQVVDVPPQEVITKDNVVVTVDAIVYYQATDPVKLKYNVATFILAATKLAQTNLRNVIGDMDLDAALTSREVINTELRAILDEATDVWGTRVVRVEIQRIDPPADVTEAMHRQMKAERDRRAAVTAAEGEKRAAILTAGGLRRYVVHPQCATTIKGFQNYRARELDDGSFSAKPDPDPANHRFSHPTDAARYLMWTQRRVLGLGAIESEGGE